MYAYTPYAKNLFDLACKPRAFELAKIPESKMIFGSCAFFVYSLILASKFAPYSSSLSFQNQEELDKWKENSFKKGGQAVGCTLYAFSETYFVSNYNNLQNRIRFYVRTYYLYYKHLTARDEYIPVYTHQNSCKL